MTRGRAILLVAAVLTLLGLGGSMIPRGEAAQPALAGTVLPPRPAPDFRLIDQFGHHISLTLFRGHPVVLTFMESHCAELCSTVAETLRRTISDLGPDGKRIVVLAVSTDPEHDTSASARWFSWQHGMLHRWHYLMGSRSQLAPLWRAYYLYVAPAAAPPKLRDAHTSATYLIDTSGQRRVLMSGDPDGGLLVRDLRILAGLPPGGAQSVVAAPEVGHPAPDFALRSLDGEVIHLGALRHSYVLLNFWATWCTACRSEMPMLTQWYRGLHRKGIIILGVNQQESASSARRFAHEFNIPYSIVLDESGAVSARYDVAGLPKTLLIDGQGIVRYVKLGGLDRSDLFTKIRHLMSSNRA